MTSSSSLTACLTVTYHYNWKKDNTLIKLNKKKKNNKKKKKKPDVEYERP